MIDTQANDDMIVKMKASVAQLAQFKDEFRKVKELYEERRLDAISELASTAQLVDKFFPDVVRELVSELYWHHLDINTKEIATIFRLKSAQSAVLVAGAARVANKVCRKCGGPLFVNSRSELQRAEYHCQKCEEDMRKEIETAREKRRIAEYQMAADREREQEESEASIATYAAPEGNARLLEPELRSMPYKEYLQTDHWKTTRYEALRRARFSCQLCNAKKPLHVHHRTYERRGSELPSDLIVLCADCHHHFHHRMNDPVVSGVS